MAEPAENSFVITVVLRGVKRAQAMAFAAELDLAATWAEVPTPSAVFVAHLKDEA